MRHRLGKQPWTRLCAYDGNNTATNNRNDNVSNDDNNSNIIITTTTTTTTTTNITNDNRHAITYNSICKESVWGSSLGAPCRAGRLSLDRIAWYLYVCVCVYTYIYMYIYDYIYIYTYIHTEREREMCIRRSVIVIHSNT